MKDDKTILGYKVGITGGRPTMYPGIEILNQLYIIDDLSAGEIEKKYGVSKETVRNWIKKARKGIDKK